ncbi:DNA-directed RNA polymerase II subunit rpb4 [Fulvia fulva]|uniref:DNA-directed RNA polymerase II subunit rpb4 n=1 Tax=Passalora fulva TaxID=5499 RepID=A0A9Q8L4U4_PASFU|nr:DNA-directed RNA polymerase II subunit rpb4 [Fulvia fulva]KAK4635238.1 DNA-directed RNA polymerase II subunit rpb4 [Fulvia fulva]KAK4637433.1 DNA-directed RNA polymerase II subunit rpb4 [Fulvia fulva]UJO10900.1 DNA-directed RNA polymerase II subunit rpb4 [Fulvia fulva]WPV09140.1 DNA-directed RNA polymerase II subunit rpb4 [Fulvia fulva]WPV23404.1 DNA-directed RNA polymerase II subunit rpb4 [Fulvia fulva]
MAGPQSRVPAPTSRRRPPPTGDEEATTHLKLGEMSGEQALSPAEVTLMLDQLEKARGQPNHTEIYYKTRDYCRHFARFKDDNSIRQVNQISTELTERELGITQFERAQLATLCCDTAEEARTLVPSLEGKIGDDELEIVLNDIAKLRDFQ